MPSKPVTEIAVVARGGHATGVAWVQGVADFVSGWNASGSGPGWRVVFYHDTGEGDSPGVLSRSRGRHRPDGLIGRADHLVPYLAEVEVPAVAIEDPFDLIGPPNTASVLLDNVAIGRMAAEHLLEREYAHHAFLGMPGWWSDQRRDGYVERLRESGHACLSRQVEPLDPASLPDLTAWTDQLPRRTAILAASDWLALSYLELVRRTDRKVPQDLAVLGVDNHPLYGPFAAVSLSSVNPNLHAVGYEAARMLAAHLGGDDQTGRRLYVQPSGVEERDSTASLLHGDETLDRALRMIRDFEQWPVTLDDVADAVGLSRRALERHFKSAMGRPPGDVLRESRRQLALSLLTTTTLPMLSVAMRCGFSTAGNFSRAFHADVGQMPSAVRAKSKAHGRTGRDKSEAFSRST